MKHALQAIDAFYEEIEAYPDQAMPAVCADDILRAKELGKIALVLKTQGVEGLEGDLRILRIWYRLGLRVLGLTWNGRNEAADGVGERRTGGGLTNFGVDLIKECNRLGIIVDVAHVAPAGVRDVLELCESPVIVTHANCHALWPHPRNLTDAQLEAIARQGGVVGVHYDPHFYGETEVYTHLSVMLDHIDHMVSVMGEDGVGFGMDFDGVEEHMEGIEDVSKLPNLTKGLAERGHSAEAIKKILGGNFLRVVREVL
jgi:membrane dipeptidase